MYVTASLYILFFSANNFLISSVIFVISNSFHFCYVVSFSTFFRDFPVLGRDSRHHAPPRHAPPQHTPATTSRPTAAHLTTTHPTTARPTTVTHHVAVSLLISLLLLHFIREIIDFNEHQPRIKRG